MAKNPWRQKIHDMFTKASEQCNKQFRAGEELCVLQNGRMMDQVAKIMEQNGYFQAAPPSTEYTFYAPYSSTIREDQAKAWFEKNAKKLKSGKTPFVRQDGVRSRTYVSNKYEGLLTVDYKSNLDLIYIFDDEAQALIQKLCKKAGFRLDKVRSHPFVDPRSGYLLAMTFEDEPPVPPVPVYHY